MPELNRRAKIRLSLPALEQLLQLPPGVEIAAVQAKMEPPMVEVVLVSQRFPVQDSAVESPVIRQPVVERVTLRGTSVDWEGALSEVVAPPF